MIEKHILDTALNKIINNNPNILNTGFYELDDILDNVDYGSLITIASCPGMGKTAFLQTLMYNIAKNGNKCLLFAVSMPVTTFIQRLLFTISEVDNFCLHNKNLLGQKNIEKLNNAKQELSELDITIIDDIYKINLIEEKIKNIKPQYVFIDSADLLYNFNDNKPISEIYTNLKSIAKSNNCIIFNTNHLSEKVEERENKRPILSDLNECGANIISDVVLFLYRENFYEIKESDNLHVYRAEIIVSKNNDGACGVVPLIFRGNFLKFYNPTNDVIENLPK